MIRSNYRPYFTTIVTLLAGSVIVVLGAENPYDLPIMTLRAEGNSDAGQQSPPINVTVSHEKQFRKYMEIAETILTLIRLSPMLAQEVQKCLDESDAFHKILNQLPRTPPPESTSTMKNSVEMDLLKKQTEY